MYRRCLTFSMTFVATLNLVSSAYGADEPARRIASLGPKTVGSTLSEVRSYKRGDNCWIEKDQADCEFIDPKSGVRYVVFNKNVSQVIARQSEAKVTLPLGLQFGESLSAVQKKLASIGGDAWVLIPYLEALSSTGDYEVKSGWTFKVQLRFSRGSLTEVRYESCPL